MQHEYLEKVSIGFVLPIIWFIQQTKDMIVIKTNFRNFSEQNLHGFK